MVKRTNETLVADGVGMYLEEVATHELLTAEDEVRLARAMEAGRQAHRRLEETDGKLPPEDRAALKPANGWHG